MNIENPMIDSPCNPANFSEATDAYYEGKVEGRREAEAELAMYKKALDLADGWIGCRCHNPRDCPNYKGIGCKCSNAEYFLKKAGEVEYE